MKNTQASRLKWRKTEIRDQFPNKNRVPIVKNPRFSWLYDLPTVP